MSGQEIQLLQAKKTNRLAGLLVLLPAAFGILVAPAKARAGDVIEAFEDCTRFNSDARQLECFRDTLDRLRARISGGAGSESPEGSLAQGTPTGTNSTQAAEPATQSVANVSVVASADQAEASGSASAEDPATYADGSGNQGEATHGGDAQMPDSLQQPGGLTVTNASRTVFGKLVIELDNEEVWIEVDGSYYKGKVRPGDAAVITKRRFGGYRMKINDQPGTVLVRLAK